MQSLPAHAPPTEVTPHLPYTNLLITHKSITVHTLTLSKEEGEGGARPPRPQLSPATHPPVPKPLINLGSSLYSTPLPDTKTTLPLLIIEDCRLEQQHPLSLPTRGFRNNGGLDLSSGLGVLALPPPDPPPNVAMPLDCGGQPPHTWHDDLCGFLKLCINAVWTGYNQRPRAFGLSPGPRPRPSFGGELGWPNYGPNRLGRSVYGPYPFLWCSRGVSVSV